MRRFTGFLSGVVALSVVFIQVAPAISGPVDPGYAGDSVMMVVDVSGSMSGTPLVQAKDALHETFASLDDAVAVGLRSYSGSCFDPQPLNPDVAVGLDNRVELATVVDGLSAGGGTPTPDALRAAVGDLPDQGTRKVVLISDGESTCGPACTVAEELTSTESVDFTVFTVGFNAPSSAVTDLTCTANATGGTYFEATDTESLADAIGDALDLISVDIVILGGESAVSGSVESRLATCTIGSVSRIAGSNRYSTAAAVSTAFLSPGVETAYVATGENFPDALAGSAAAGAGIGGPVLLVRPTSVPSETAAELNRLNPDVIVLLGGTAAISTGVENSLKAYGTVVRVAGADRYSTGSSVSSYAFSAGANTAYVATGTNFPDALAGGPAAVGAQGPVLLVQQNAIPSSVRLELARLGLSTIKVLGGTAAVSASVEADLHGYASDVDRLSGSDRYATAAAVSKDTFSPGIEIIFVATGTNFPDALAGGPIAGTLGGPILLVKQDSIPGSTETEIERLTGATCAAP